MRKWILLLLVVSCRQPINNKAQNSCDGSQKITGIERDFVYDLSSYDVDENGSPYNLFDENDEFDPRNGITGIPQRGPHPVLHPDIYFPLNKGSRIVADLRIPYMLSEVYLYDHSTLQDTVWIYTGNMQNWKLQETIVTKDDPTGWGWRKFSIHDSTRFIMIRFNSYGANITEMVLYGCPLAKIPSASQNKQATALPKKTLKEFLGVNMYNTMPLEWLRPFSWVRMYTNANMFDTDTLNNYPNNKISFSRFGYLYKQDSFHHFSDDLAAVQKKIWYSIRGVPVVLNKLGFWDNDRPVTKLGMDPESPSSYGRHSKMMWTLAAVFGKTKVDTDALMISDMIKVSGKGTMICYENGNEENATWVGNKFCSPMEYFSQSSADYDGHQGLLGKFNGVHSADTSSELIMSGTVGFDTNRVKVLNFLCNELRSDKRFLWQGGIQYHHYSTRLTSRSIFNRKKKFVAITPEEDSLRAKCLKVREFTSRFQPGVECILGEYGYDKSPGSPNVSPIVPGFSSAQSQGILLLRGINAVAFSGFDRMMIYWMKDDADENFPGLYATSGIVRGFPDGTIKPYPAWFYISTLIDRLGNYMPDSIISEKGDVWVYRYRNQLNKDSNAYFVYCPTRNGKKVSNYTLKVPLQNGTATEINFSDTSSAGREVTRQIQNGTISLSVTEFPEIIILKNR